MDNQNLYTENPQKIKVPILIKVFSWFLLLDGLNVFSLSLMSWFIGARFLSLFHLIAGATYIMVAFNLRKMKLWTLHIMTIVSITSIFLFAYNNINGVALQGYGFLGTMINLIILIYLWSISKDFIRDNSKLSNLNKTQIFLLSVLLFGTVIGLSFIEGKILDEKYGPEDSSSVIDSVTDMASSTKETEASIVGISIQKPNLIISGQNLFRVEIYVFPSGTGMEDMSYSIGEAKKESEINNQQVWSFPISEKPMMITHIFVKGFDNNNQEVGQLYLPIIGVTALHEALWQNEVMDWKTYRSEEYGYEFKYPEELNQTYIEHSGKWPPTVTVGPVDPDFVCEEFESQPGYGPQRDQKEVIFNNSKYCLLVMAEGAAGSTYADYKYITNRNDKQLTIEFVLRSPSCGAFYEVDNKMEECREEVSNFFEEDIGSTKLIDQILSTFRFLE